MTTSVQQNFADVSGDARITKTMEALATNGYLPEVVATKADALAKIKELIPKNASVMNGSSQTLEQIGFVDYLKEGAHGWNNLHENILKEADSEKQAKLRKESVLSDFYLGSVHALTESGEMIIASNTGSQLPHIVFTSQNVIFVVGGQKIVSDIMVGFERIEKHIIPLEDVNIMEKYNMHTQHSKSVILHKENAMMGRKVHVIIVKESLGF